ncbi:MAG: (Fe-S)-binding protein [Proteobacteria bacterium]|nr:(Fe-S)-binding protein [Pseudomonadota bacterium]MBU4286687.1 (Fe-S)-binding protein [Pseudomonadota bacterium]MCG2757337.1 (Fe-S)-binding protein [Desulfobacteraceae bacterium]
MPSMKELALLMKELEHQLNICTRCGMCQAVCPLYDQTGIEADVARGKLALLEGLAEEMFKNPKGVYERLSRCLLCGSCEANCPSGVEVLEIFIKARAILTHFIGLSPAKKAILRIMLAHPYNFDRLMELLPRIQKIFTKPASKNLGTSCARLVSPLIKNRHFKSLAPVPFHHIVPTLNSYPGKSGLKVAFFVGCLIDKIFPQVAEAVIDVLNYHEVGIFVPEGQACCGIPAISTGDTQTFDRLVQHNLDKFYTTEFDCLVTACATCTAVIKKIWPMMIKKQSSVIRSRVEKLAEKTMDINQFLVSKTGFTRGSYYGNEKKIVTYHDPCHLLKTLGISDEPRALIKANQKYTLKEMHESDWCCGLGGSFNLQYYDISAKIGKRKRDNIKLTNCSVVATGCPACMIQISEMLSKYGDSIVVKHPVTIYAESLKNNISN